MLSFFPQGFLTTFDEEGLIMKAVLLRYFAFQIPKDLVKATQDSRKHKQKCTQHRKSLMALSPTH